ncbi:MFS transporter [Candidatus Daviesbacteria bacterium]|nr:MFS transporter [Candidatus Daviesbacteria bacterium]
MQQHASFSTVIRNRGFLNLWINQILVQFAYNSLNFALIIWVFKLTDSNTAVSALLFAVYLPAVILGLLTGILVDVTDRKKVILWVNFLLAVCFISLIYLKTNFIALLAVTFFINTLIQFYNPSEASAIPLVVKKHQLLAANALFSITLFSAFLLGFGLAGPLLTHLGINFVFKLEAVLASAAFLMAFRFPPILNKRDEQGRLLIKALRQKDAGSIKRVVLQEIGETIRLIRGKLIVFSAIMIMAGVQMVIGVLAVLVPSFFERVVQIRATEASLVLVLPLGLGMVLGGFCLGRLGHKFPRRIIVGRGIILAGLLLFTVGFAPIISPAIKYSERIITNNRIMMLRKPKPLPFFYQPPLSAVLAFGSFLLGVAMVSIVVPSQTVIQDSTPEGDRGKVFSTLGVVMAGMSLLPVLFAGVMADVFGTTPIFIALGGVISILGFLALKPDFFFAEHHLPLHMKQFLGLGHWRKK